MQLLQEKCDPGVATDKTLPTSAYLVTYKLEGEDTYDLVISGKAADIFDEYYDKYKKDFVTMKQAEGIISPNLWQDRSVVNEPPKKKRKRKPDNA